MASALWPQFRWSPPQYNSAFNVDVAAEFDSPFLRDSIGYIPRLMMISDGELVQLGRFLVMSVFSLGVLLYLVERQGRFNRR